MTQVIQFKNIKKNFGKRVILDGINLEVYEKEIFGVIGMSGSGKSTILKTLIGYIIYRTYIDKNPVINRIFHKNN